MFSKFDFSLYKNSFDWYMIYTFQLLHALSALITKFLNVSVGGIERSRF